jgi:pyrroloquinoline quinone biosynthesis protein D
MNAIVKETVPRLAPGCRMGAGEGREDMLLIPEGALRMRGPARMIIERCDGQRTVGVIIDELCGFFPAENRTRIETEVVELFARLHGRGAIELA